MNRPFLQGLLALGVLLLPATVHAQLSYETNEDNASVTVIHYDDVGGPSVNIPAFYGDLPVTAIADEAFESNTVITDVVIGTNVGTIGVDAFYGSSLRSITISGSVTNFEFSFYGSDLHQAVIDSGVTKISDYAFGECDYLTNVSIPETVVEIGTDAFFDCDALTNVDFPSNLTTIDGGAFDSCGIGSALINGVTNLGDGAFEYCAYLTNLGIDSLVNIPGDAFSECGALQGITIPEGVTNIGSEAFESAGLTNVHIPMGVISLGEYAFEACPDLTNITFEPGLTTIGDFAFAYDPLQSLTLPDGATNLGEEILSASYVTNVILPGDLTTLAPSVLSYCYELSSLTIPNGVTNIGDYALFGSGLTNVWIPNGVLSIGASAFADNTYLLDVTIPSSVTNIAEDAFGDCTSLAGAYFYGNAPPDNGLAFEDDTNAVAYYLPGATGWSNAFSGIPTAYWGYFTYTTNGDNTINVSGFTGGGSAIIPANVNGLPVSTIGAGAFAGDSLLTSITLSGITNIGSNAFENCTNLTSIWINGDAPSATPSVFGNDTNVVVYYQPGASGWSNMFDGIPAVAMTAADQFSFNTNSDNTLAISGYLGSNESLIIPDMAYGMTVSVIEEYAAENESLTNLIIPDTIGLIGQFAFGGDDMTNVLIPDGVTNIQSTAFEDNYSLMAINVGANNGHYSSTGGVLFDKLQMNLLEYPGGPGGGYAIPDTVVGIGEDAFEDCDVSSVTIPDTVTTIGSSAFSSCDNLDQITIPGSVFSVGNGAFEYCYSLSGVVLSNGIANIGSDAFFDDGLTNIDFPASVTNIGEDALLDCYALTNISVEPGSDFYSSTNGVLFDITQTNLITYPGGLGGSYTVPASVIIISPQAFEADSLTSVTIPGNVTNIGDNAFEGCSSLSQVTLSEGLIAIGSTVFWDTALTSVTIPSTVTSIGPGPFGDCLDLTSISVAGGNDNYYSQDGALFSSSPVTLIQFPGGVTGGYTIPGNVTEIGLYAFEGCSLSEVTIPGTVNSIDSWAFYGCSNLTNVTIGNGVGSIGEYAFYDSGLIGVNIPPSVSDIEYYAFEDCFNLTSLTISDGVQVIEPGAFATCQALTSFTVPASISSIGNGAFENCGDLTAIYFQGNAPGSGVYLFYDDPDAVAYYEPGTTGWGSTYAGIPAVLLSGFTYTANDDGSVTITGYTGTSSALIIPGSIGDQNVTGIATNALEGDTNLTSLEISAGVTNIGSDAFANCPNLAAIYFDGQPPSVGANAFANDPGATIYYPWDTEGWSSPFAGLTAIEMTDPDDFTTSDNDDGTLSITGYTGPEEGGVVIPDEIDGLAVSTIGPAAFISDYITSVVFPPTMDDIGFQAFYGCLDLQSAFIPGSVTNIDEYAFFQTAISNVYIPGSVVTIGPEAFGEINSMFDLTISEGVRNIDGFAFYSSLVLSHVFIPASVTNIGPAVFEDCTSLTNIEVAPSNPIYSSEDGVLMATNGTTLVEFPPGLDYGGSYTVPGTVTNIGVEAFEYDRVTNVILPEGVAHISAEAFESSHLVQINIPASVTGIDSGALIDCAELTSITVAAGNPDYASVDGVLFDKDLDTLITYPEDRATADYEIPNTVTDIGDYSFRDSQVTSVAIPDSVVSIGVAAFEGCDNLTSVVISDSVEQIGVYAFVDDSSLVSVYFEGDAPDVDFTAFLGDSAATAYYLPGTTGWGATIGGITVEDLGASALYSFSELMGDDQTNSDGANPVGDLLLVGDTFYGTANEGGSNDYGTVFAIGTNGLGFTVLHTFADDGDGIYPAGGLILTSKLLYGTTVNGGAHGDGTIFALSPDGTTYNKLHDFGANQDGVEPQAGLVLGGSKLFGTTYSGGSNGYGIVFSYDIASSNYSILYNFTGANDGGYPGAGLVLGGPTLYGTTERGGEFDYGTVFSIFFNGLEFSNLFSFHEENGSYPAAQLLFSGKTLYGTASGGGEYESGVVFSLNTNGQCFSDLYDFGTDSDSDGDEPAAGLILSGNTLYGTTEYGGASDEGTIFSVRTNGMCYSNIYSFTGGFDGGDLQDSPLLLGGVFYGTATDGGANDEGSIFRIGLQPGSADIGPPNIVSGPYSASPALEGLFATFSVDASGAPPLSYQWYLNGEALSEDGEFSGVNSSTLTVDPLFTDDAGSYSVIVSNSIGIEESAIATLNVYPYTNKMEDFEAGTNYIAAGFFLDANNVFSNLLIQCPSNNTDLFYDAATLVLSLPQQPPGSNFLNRLDVGALGRDIFDWTASMPENSRGHLIIPATSPPLNAQEFTEVLRTNVLPTLVASGSLLSQITNTNFIVCLTSNETHCSSVMVDWGDVQMLQAMGQAEVCFIYMLHSWNFDVQMAAATNYFGTNGSIENFLTNYPNVLMTTNTADLPAARVAFSNAVSNYFVASDWIRSRPCYEIRLFNLDPFKTNAEFKFRETLSNLLASMSGPAVPLTTDPGVTVSMQSFFSGNFSPGAYLPDFQGGSYVWDSFPDTTLGGLFGGLTQKDLGKLFTHHIVLDLAGAEVSVLYDFNQFNGQSGIVEGLDGNFYGAMASGGPFVDEDTNGFGFGSIFRVTPDGQASILYNFGSHMSAAGVALDGAYPTPLVLGSDGNFYGATVGGGSNNDGTVFKITTSGQLTELYSFGTNLDAHSFYPVAALAEGSDGVFYGTASRGGGSDSGIIFGISSKGALTNLYSFTNGDDGSTPAAQLVVGTNGLLYGTVAQAGAYGYGTIFEVNPAQPYHLTLLHGFGSSTNDAGGPLDGVVPNSLVFGADGNLYGTAEYGGANDNYAGEFAYIFPGASGVGDGTLFRINPGNPDSFAVLYNFDSSFTDGYNPVGSLVSRGNGLFYGVASAGGPDNHGAVFAFHSGAPSDIVWFTDADGKFGGNFQSFESVPQLFEDFFDYIYVNPAPSLLTLGFDGNLYGMTADGGANGSGTIYEVNITPAIALNSPSNGQYFSSPAALVLSSTVSNAPAGTTVNYYSVTAAFNGSSYVYSTNLLGSASTPPYNLPKTFAGGGYAVFAEAIETNGIDAYTEPVYFTVNSGVTNLIDFDALADDGAVVSNAPLSQYLAQYGVSIVSNTPGTRVVAENQSLVGGGGFVVAASYPNVLTQIGAGGRVGFTLDFAAPVTQVGFTRPELVANPSISFPAWNAVAFDSLGLEVDEVEASQITSSTNVPPQSYSLSGGSISSVEFNSLGSGLNTVNDMVLDNLLLTPGTGADLPPSVALISPTNGQVFLSAASIPLDVATASGSGTIIGVGYFYNGTHAASSTATPFSAVGPVPGSGGYVVTAVATNSSGLITTSAPVNVTVANGFVIISQPVSKTIGLNGAASFSVTATGTNVTYQWRLNGLSIVGATSSTYKITGASAANSGSYSVTITSDGEVISSSNAVLTVLGPPTLSAATITSNGQNITLSINADDTVPYYYQWQLNGNGIAGANGSFSNGGANPISYTITNARPFNSGNYQVNVANAVAAQESPSFNVVKNYGTPISTNFNFASRLTFDPFTGVAGSNNSTLSAAPTDGPTNIAGKPVGGFLWYSWTADFTGVISLTTRGSTFDTVMGVYTGTNLNTLQSVAQDDDSGGFFTSLVTFDCTNGTAYQIAVAGYRGATGIVELGLSPGPPLLPGPLYGSITNVSYPIILTNPVNQIVQAGGTVNLDVAAADASSYQWWFGTEAVPGNLGGTNADFTVNNFQSSEVGNYYATVSNAIGVVQSRMATVEIASQTNDNVGGTPTTLLTDKFFDAVDLTSGQTPSRYRPKPEDGGGETGGFTLSQSFSTIGATKEASEPNHAGQPGGASYWYSYTALTNGTLEATTDGSSFNTILAVYVGPGNSFSTLTNVGSGYTTNYVQNGQPDVTISNVAARTKYYIAVDGYLGTSGSAQISISLNAPPAGTNANAVYITNSPPIITVTSPANHSLATTARILLKGAIKGGVPGKTVVEVTLPGGSVSNASVSTTANSWFVANVPLNPGPNAIVVQSFNTNTGMASLPVTTVVFYDTTAPSASVKSTLHLLTNGPGTFKGQKNGASLEVGKVYSVTAVPQTTHYVFANWNIGTNTNNLNPYPSGPTLVFDMQSNMFLQAVFVTNPYPAVAGVYNGLFYPSNGMTEASSGYLTADLNNDNTGAYSAKMTLDGGTYSFTGLFDIDLFSEAILPRAGKSALTIDLQLATNDVMTGTVSENVTNGWVSQVYANRVVFNSKTTTTNFAGKFTLIVPSSGATNEPAGYGYATLANTSSGAVALSGTLADNTAISQSSTVSADGTIPIYIPLYSKKGLLMGWLSLEDENSAGQAQSVQGSDFAWIKTNVPKGLYSAGFTNTNLTVMGTYYKAPAKGGNSLELSGGTFTYSYTATNSLIVTNVTVTGNKVTSENDELTGTIAPSTGLLTITLKPATGPAVKATGVILQNTNITTTNAAGWLLGTNKSGYFLLQQ